MPSIPIYRAKDRIGALTTVSANPKTGNMQQLYILPDTMSPYEAVKTGNDKKVCGECDGRGTASGGKGWCYVLVFQGPRQVWETVKNMAVQKAPETTQPVRLGAWGDPAFLPFRLVKNLVKGRRWTGYTHQWNEKSAKWAQYCMASVDNNMATRLGLTISQLRQKAKALGYRTYRMVHNANELEKDEVLCPHESHSVQCITCGLCNGAGKAKSVAVLATGGQKGAYI